MGFGDFPVRCPECSGTTSQHAIVALGKCIQCTVRADKQRLCDCGAKATRNPTLHADWCSAS